MIDTNDKNSELKEQTGIITGDDEISQDNLEINHVFDNIKESVIHSRNKIYSTVNMEMLHLYWNINKIIMGIQQGG